MSKLTDQLGFFSGEGPGEPGSGAGAGSGVAGAAGAGAAGAGGSAAGAGAGAAGAGGSAAGAGASAADPAGSLSDALGYTPAVFHTACIETQYLPPAETFARLLPFKRIRLEAWEFWVKRSYRNRAHVAGPNGRLVLSIPLERRGGERRLSGQVRICYAEPWLQDHWKTLEAGYRRSPFFEYYEDRFEPIFNTRYETLLERNLALFGFFAEALGLQWDLGLTDAYHRELPLGWVDLRNAVMPSGGRPDPFYTAPVYRQVFEERHGFLPGLSIADLLFNEGPGSAEVLRGAGG